MQPHKVGTDALVGNPTQPLPRGGVPTGSWLEQVFPTRDNALKQGQTPSSVRYISRVFRTDEGVCPYRFVSFPFKEGVPLYQREAFFIARKRPLQSEEGVSLFCLQRFRLMRHCLVTYQPTIPWLASVRHSSPLGRLGGVSGGAWGGSKKGKNHYSSSPFRVGMTGFELATPTSRTQCATNCATSRQPLQAVAKVVIFSELVQCFILFLY